jgi:serpin B
MTIVMPDDPAGLDALVDSLNGDRWSGWMDALDSTRLVVSMPRFTVASDLTLNDALAALGMPTAFCGPWVTDFSRMITGVAACISNVKHKTWVEVNEEGTEAAAATSVEIGVTSAPQAIVVDRPFVFAIRERFSGTILFIGKVVDPAAS